MQQGEKGGDRKMIFREADRAVVLRDEDGVRQHCRCGCERFRRIINVRRRYKCTKCGRVYFVKEKE